MSNYEIRDNLVAALFTLAGSLAMICLFFVFIVHLKYKRFREDDYSFVFGLVICEYIYAFNFFWTGVKKFLFEEQNEFVCMINSLFIFGLLHLIFSYNTLIMIFMIFKKLPSVANRKSFKSKFENKSNSKFIYYFTHVFSFLLGLIMSVFLYLTENYGESFFSSCFLKKDLNLWMNILVIPFFIYFFVGVVFLILNFKSNYTMLYPCLKNTGKYSILTALIWFGQAINMNLRNPNEDFNAVAVSINIFSLIVISYFRISIGYIQNILKGGSEGNNKFVQAVLILFCLETKQDPQEYEMKKNIKIEALSHDFSTIN